MPGLPRRGATGGLSKVIADGAYASLTGGSTVAPPANTYGLVIVEPANTTGGGGLRITDRVSDGGGGNGNAYALLTLAHEGSNNAMDIFNYSASTNLALGVHNYQSASTAVQFDQTGSGAVLKLSNAQNSSANPGSHGTGDYIQFSGPYTYDTTAATGVVTGGNTLTDTTTPAAFAAEDVGKPITVGLVTTTIATVVSATQITTASSSLVNASGVTYSYAKATSVMLRIDKTLTYTNLSTTPVTFVSSTGATRSLQVQQGAGATQDALNVLNLGSGNGVTITQTTATGNALKVSHSVGSTGVVIDASNAGTAGFYAQTIATTKFGLSVSSNTDHSSSTEAVLKVTKVTATGVGILALINNPGTGPSLVLQTSGTSHIEFNSNADVNITNSNGWKIGTATTQKIGLYAATPVAQATRVGQLTDSTTGTPSTTIGDAGAAYSQATINNIHASLLAKINALDVRLSAAGGGIGITA